MVKDKVVCINFKTRATLKAFIETEKQHSDINYICLHFRT
jgi:hypothetical protein